MEVKINKEIRNYTESMFFGLSMRLMKQIQEWLGHSDFSTTANVYAHLDYNSKLSSADAMAKGLSGALGVIS